MDKKEPKNVSKAHMETINRGRNLRPAGKATTAINNDLHESTINSIEDQFNTAKYNFSLINKLARGNKQNITDYLPPVPIRSNKLYPKFIISSVESFGPALALKALILNGYFETPKMLFEISNYASTIFFRSYEVQDFNYGLKELLKSGILIQGDGTSIPEDKYVLNEGAEIGWKL